MISFRRNLVSGKNVEDEKSIVSLHKQKIPVDGIYLICISKDGKNFMEIIPSREIFKDIHGPKNFTVIGLARGYLEAREVTAGILREYITSGQELSRFREVFLARGSEGGNF